MRGDNAATLNNDDRVLSGKQLDIFHLYFLYLAS
jgi:hypothetical protein